MARISIDEIKKDLSAVGWELLSESYKNLDTNLDMKCDKGHILSAPWKKIRDNKICPTCMRERLKTKEFKNTKKKPDEYRILAIDQATRISGYSVFSNKKLIDYGTFETTNDKSILDRSVEVKQWMISLIDQYQIDFVGLEGIQYQAAAGVTTFEALARLQGILAAACIEEHIPYGIAPTNTWRDHCGVQGRARTDRKRSMQLLIKNWFDLQVDEDTADAIGIGKYFSDIQTPKVEIIDWETN